MLTMRLPPNKWGEDAEAALRKIVLENEAPYNATVELPLVIAKAGWICNEYSEWAKQAFIECSN